LDQARAALAALVPEDGPVLLESPPGAAGWEGIGWWLGLIERVVAEHPAFTLTAVLDCGDSPGLALAAIREGVRGIRLDAAPEVLAKIADIAGQAGAIVEGFEEQ
jgi:hypothetical protein